MTSDMLWAVVLFLLFWTVLAFFCAVVFGTVARVGSGEEAKSRSSIFTEYSHAIPCRCGTRRDGTHWIDPNCVSLTRFLRLRNKRG